MLGRKGTLGVIQKEDDGGYPREGVKGGCRGGCLG